MPVEILQKILQLDLYLILENRARWLDYFDSIGTT
jgi:hypothetical protein